MADAKDKIEAEAVEIIEKEHNLSNELMVLESELRNTNPKFQQFIEKQSELKLVQSQSEIFWDTIKTEMIAHDIKSIKGEWGSITVAERVNYKAIDNNLEGVARKFIKKVLDTTEVGRTHKLEGKIPKGIDSTITKYLMKRLK